MGLRFNPSAQHNARLACSAEEFDTLKAGLAAVIAAQGEDVFSRHLAGVIAQGKARDPILRTRFDSFWAARRHFPENPDTGAPRAFSDAKDSHIESALRLLLVEGN